MVSDGIKAYLKLDKLKTYGDLVMFSHTLFSLPFALIAMLWAAKGLPSPWTFFWMLVALAGARNGANALNRLVDKDIDAKNPRTAGRHLPKGIVGSLEVVLLILVCFAIYIFAAFMLNPLCVILSPLPVLVFMLYSYTKRFTWACHIVLGIACGGAPVGAWIAVQGNISWTSLILGAIVTLWVAGFDIIYAVQDVEFDRNESLFSIPSIFGIKNALAISSVFHVAAVGMLVYLSFLQNTGTFYYIGIGAAIILLLIEHILVTPKNMRNVKFASYNINQIVSVVLFIFTALDVFVR
ncbi:MAG: 4-hydroxybenzoate octaprenyltransferase [Clostridiales bacterium]|jgi:4-hydroxybenzoate polyprenyltransferase|nr:4-hydroxybenzoate octaprenyltransferase [Clostridiales bacterium]